MKSLIINNEECRSLDGFDRYHISESGRVYRTDLKTPRSARSKDKIYLSENKVHYKIGKNTLRHGRVSITDNTGKAYSFAKEYIDTYKDSFRPVPDIITKGGNTRKFILKGPDEKFVADMLTGPQGKRSRFNALRNLNIKQRKVK